MTEIDLATKEDQSLSKKQKDRRHSAKKSQDDGTIEKIVMMILK